MGTELKVDVEIKIMLTFKGEGEFQTFKSMIASVASRTRADGYADPGYPETVIALANKMSAQLNTGA